MGWAANMPKGTFWDDGNVLKLRCGDSNRSVYLLKIIKLCTK